MAEAISMFSRANVNGCGPDPILQIERGLLGAMMTNARKAIAALPPSFSSEHYLDDLHRDIHDAIVGAEAEGADLLSILLGVTGRDAAYIAQLTTAFVSLIHVPPYAEAITEAYHRRNLILIAERMISDARAGTRETPAAGIMTQAISAMDALMCGTAGGRGGVSMDEALDAAIEHAQRAARGEPLGGRSTGFASIDEAMGGLEDGTFNILAARPGMGKTALAVQIAVKIARQIRESEERAGVLGISLEMRAPALARRMIAEAARVSVTDLKRGNIEGREAMISNARHKLAGLPIWIEDVGGQSIAGIRQKARAFTRRFGKIGLLWVDHIQIVKPEDVDRKNGATQAVGRISNGLAALAKEFDCPVLCLAQLNRGLLAREDKRPNLGDLRQAGDIEQDADTVAFVHREEAFLPKSAPPRIANETTEKHAERVRSWDEACIRARGKAELIFEKVRDGAPGSVELGWDGPTTSFHEPPAQAPAAAPSQSRLSDWHDGYFADDPGPSMGAL